ncbi:hypothetical protein [Halomicrobium katesii]|uniref:hypothetical protein n=1 Tax=Halomicrobium katesii TaxID=437163 RepID=UPI00035E4E41|nr:hypothetical protein [Halomicrobium katesii]
MADCEQYTDIPTETGSYEIEADTGNHRLYLTIRDALDGNQMQAAADEAMTATSVEEAEQLLS